MAEITKEQMKEAMKHSEEAVDKGVDPVALIVATAKAMGGMASVVMTDDKKAVVGIVLGNEGFVEEVLQPLRDDGAKSEEVDLDG